MNVDDRIRAAARQLDPPADLARSLRGYWRLEGRYAAEMTHPASAAALHRRAVGIDAFLSGEAAARAGRPDDAEEHFAAAARHGIGGHPGEDPSAADVASARAGDRLAAERLLQEIRPFVEAICRARVRSVEWHERAREIALAVLAALPDHPQVPVLELAHEMTVQALGTRRADPDPRALLRSRTWRAAVSEILHLPQKQRDVLVLRILLGMSADETAEIVGSTPGAVRVAQHKALARLRSRQLGQRPEGGSAADHVELRVTLARRPERR